MTAVHETAISDFPVIDGSNPAVGGEPVVGTRPAVSPRTTAGVGTGR